MKEEKPIFLLEKVPGFDLRMKLQGDPLKIIQMLQGAMTVEPDLQFMLQTAIDTLPIFKQCITPTIMKDFTGKVHQ